MAIDVGFGCHRSRALNRSALVWIMPKRRASASETQRAGRCPPNGTLVWRVRLRHVMNRLCGTRLPLAVLLPNAEFAGSQPPAREQPLLDQRCNLQIAGIRHVDGVFTPLTQA